MSSPCRSDLVLMTIATCALFVAGCDRERHEYYAAPTVAAPSQPRLSTLQPGDRLASPADAIGAHYESNAYHINQGSRLYRWFNCNGCHANGGGSIGPALMDGQWRYGGSMQQIHASILDGRPNGMPSWRGKITNQQAWQIAAYVRALSGNVPKAAAPSRRDAMAATPPLTQIRTQPPRNGDASASTVPPP